MAADRGRLRFVDVAVTGNDALAEALRRHPLFAVLTDDQRLRMLGSARVESLHAGQLLYSRGDESKRFFLVLEGQVNLSLHSYCGLEKIIDIQGPGQVFAEAVVFMECPVYQMTATAATPARIVSFRNETLMQALGENPQACLHVMRHLSARLHVRLREIEALTLESATSRLARLIEGRIPPGAADTATVCLDATRQEIASYLAIKPETLSRALRTLTEGGAIAVRGKTVEVLSRARLRQHEERRDGLA